MVEPMPKTARVYVAGNRGLVGSAIEENATRQPGLEITVRLNNGRMVSVTQAADEPFYRGDRVRVLTSYDGTARVVHDY